MPRSVLILLAALFSVTSCEYFRHTFSNKEIIINADNCVSQKCTDGLRCNQNCSTLQACVNNQICDVQTCDSTATTPEYCVGDKTIDDKYECGAAPTSSLCYHFQCAHEGYFPDINDVKKYYYCQSVNAIPEEYECTGIEKYDPSVQKCSERADITETLYDAVTCSTEQFCGLMPLDPYTYYLCIKESTALYTVLLSKCDTGNFLDDVCRCSDANPSF